jgi:small-conductance mechanosensitive channel
MQSLETLSGSIEQELLALPTWQAFLLVVGASVAAAWVLQVGGDALIKRLTRRIDGDVDDVVFGTLHPPLYVSVVLGGVYVAVRLLDIAPDTAFSLKAGALSLLIVLWVWTLAKLGRRVSNAASSSDALDQEVLPIFQNVWSALVLGGGIYLLLRMWSIDVTPLLASAGIIGIVVGFAARDTIANFFGSIALYVDGTYAVGDFIVLDSGERGRVEDISIRSTVIRTRDDVLVTVPNSVLNESIIVNESAPRTKRRVRIPVGVAYGSDLETVEDVLMSVAEDQDTVLDHPKARVRFQGFGDSAIDVQLMCWIPAPVHRGRATHELVKDIHVAFQDAGIEIPFPQRDVALREVAEGAVAAGGRADPDTDGVTGGTDD